MGNYATRTGFRMQRRPTTSGRRPDRAMAFPRANTGRNIALLAPHPPARERLYVALIRRYDGHVIATGRDEYLLGCPHG
jgi:hypothetical protein